MMFPSVEHDAKIVSNGEKRTQLTAYLCPAKGDKGGLDLLSE